MFYNTHWHVSSDGELRYIEGVWMKLTFTIVKTYKGKHFFYSFVLRSSTKQIKLYVLFVSISWKTENIESY